MDNSLIQIKRYPNRRYYARNTSTYVTLQEIETMIQSGLNVEIRDSQTGEDLTRSVLTQIIVERQPEKMSLFPIDMLHYILRSNGAMSDFLRDYLRQSLNYLDFLQRQRSAVNSLPQPMRWFRAWLDGISPPSPREDRPAAADADTSAQLARRVAQLEERLRQLELPQP